MSGNNSVHRHDAITDLEAGRAPWTTTDPPLPLR
jgi:hypothetical protein